MLNLFSERNNAKNIDEIIIFDELPEKLRIQFRFIVEEILDNDDYYEIHKILCKERGKLSLNPKYPLGKLDKVTLLNLFIDKNYDLNLIFDIIELTLRYYNYKLHKKFQFDKGTVINTMKDIENEINI